MEVIDLKSSAASSDEEGLAAGISTIGLQTKRLSGAQRKRLIRERKMREGTWKPVAGGSGPSLKASTYTLPLWVAV
jgi:hypothetical protein